MFKKTTLAALFIASSCFASSFDWDDDSENAVIPFNRDYTPKILNSSRISIPANVMHETKITSLKNKINALKNIQAEKQSRLDNLISQNNTVVETYQKLGDLPSRNYRLRDPFLSDANWESIYNFHIRSSSSRAPVTSSLALMEQNLSLLREERNQAEAISADNITHLQKDSEWLDHSILQTIRKNKAHITTLNRLINRSPILMWKEMIPDTPEYRREGLQQKIKAQRDHLKEFEDMLAASADNIQESQTLFRKYQFAIRAYNKLVQEHNALIERINEPVYKVLTKYGETIKTLPEYNRFASV